MIQVPLEQTYGYNIEPTITEKKESVFIGAMADLDSTVAQLRARVDTLNKRLNGIMRMPTPAAVGSCPTAAPPAPQFDSPAVCHVREVRLSLTDTIESINDILNRLDI